MNYIGRMFLGGAGCCVFLLGWDVNLVEVGIIRVLATWILGSALIAYAIDDL